MTAAKKDTATASTDISTETNTAAQEDVKINPPSLPDAFGESQLLELYAKAEKEAKSVVPDVETESGRKNIKDMARKVAASNKAVDTPMRDYLRMIKAQPKVLEKNARESKARFDTLKADILKPLEEAQAWQDSKLVWLVGIPGWCATNPTAADLSALSKDVEEFELSEVWPELKKKFKVAHEAATTTLKVTLERIEEAEKQAARLAELEEAAAAQRQKDHDREVAEAAAKQAQIEAEKKAEQDRIDVDRRAAESRQREENAKAAEARAIRDAELAEDRRKQDAIDNEAREAQAKIDAEERQAAAVKKATEDESQRIADEEAEHAKAAKDRESRKDHRASIHRGALVAMIALGIDEAAARAAILAIRDGKIPNISIQY